MRVPVIVVVPSQEPLRESATAAIEGRPPSFGLESALVPARLELDLATPAVAVPADRPGAGLESFDPQRSPAFAVRGHIEVDDPREIPESVDGQPVFADPRIEPFITCGGSTALGNANAVAAKLNLAAFHAKGLDGSDIAIAIVDTGINLVHLSTRLGSSVQFDAANSWTPPNGMTLPGRYPVDHGTMCAFDALIAAPNATLIDVPVLAGSVPGANVTGRTLGTALLAFAHLLTGWAVAFAAGGLSKYKGLVVNNSWGIYHPSWDFPAGHRGRFIDNPRHPFNIIVAALANSGADILFAAGNCGADCADMRCQGRSAGAIMGANALPVGVDARRLRHQRSACRLLVAGSFDREHVPAEAGSHDLYTLPRL